MDFGIPTQLRGEGTGGGVVGWFGEGREMQRRNEILLHDHHSENHEEEVRIIYVHMKT